MLARLNMLKTGLLLAGLLAQDALALGLGDITLSSSLNEPLDATIELIDVGNLDEAQILVALGAEEDFTRVDLERSQFLTGIRFVVETSGDTGLIRLTTADNVVEPYLSLLVDARWPTGRVLREYTLLIDLPDFSSPAQVQPARTAATSPADVTPRATPPPAPVAAPEPQAAATPAASAAANTPSINPDGTFTVNPGDTMWEIAEATRPDASVSVQQMMVAIQRANEDAFLGNNINRVRSGRVLRIPPLQEIGGIDRATAIAEISRQDLALGGQPLAVNNSGAAPATGAPQDELSVLTEDEAALPSGAGSSDLQATIAALENELMLSEENLDRARLENQELNARISSLEDEIGLLQNIIAIEDERIAQLQAELASQSEATAMALAQAQTSADALAALDQPQAGLLGQLNGILQNGMILLGVLVALVLAVLGFLVTRRRTAEAEAEEHVFNPAMLPAEPDDLAGYAGQPQEKTGMLAGWRARFGRNNADSDDLADEPVMDDDVDAPSGAPAQAFATAPSIATDSARNRTDQLLAGMDISDESAFLDDALSDIDDEASFSAVDDSFMAGSGLVQREAALADDSELEEIGHAGTTAATLPDSIEFVPAPMASLDSIESSAEPVVPEAFEFTLRETPVADVGGPVEFDAVESLEFTLDEPAPLHAGAGTDFGVDSYAGGAMDADLEALGDISFDDTMLSDDDEDDSPYKSRSGMDECDTKLDLATAYEAMGDVGDAIEILDEVIADGNPAQVEMAHKLKQSWLSA